MTHSVYFYDPDGNTLEVYTDVYSEPEGMVVMRTKVEPRRPLDIEAIAASRACGLRALGPTTWAGPAGRLMSSLSQTACCGGIACGTAGHGRWTRSHHPGDGAQPLGEMVGERKTGNITSDDITKCYFSITIN